MLSPRTHLYQSVVVRYSVCVLYVLSFLSSPYSPLRFPNDSPLTHADQSVCDEACAVVWIRQTRSHLNHHHKIV